jgi:large subunit ribosomal protein L4
MTVASMYPTIRRSPMAPMASLASLTSLTDRVGYLVVLERTDAITWLSLRNAPEVHIVAVDQLNTYDVLNSDDVVFTKGAYDVFVGGASAPAAKTVEVEKAEQPAATEQSSDEPALPAGAKAPLKSGKNPKGYEVQGLESGTYLVEGDADYDAAAGDFWFKSAEDAEAAGLTRAAKEDDK